MSSESEVRWVPVTSISQAATPTGSRHADQPHAGGQQMDIEQGSNYERLVAKYQTEMQSDRQVFPGEYTLLIDWRTLRRVRVYENGHVWENTGGEYRQVLP